ADSEELTPEQIAVESIMLGIRMREGLEISALSSAQIDRLANYAENAYLEITDNRVVLTPTGRLIADRIVREITI
ncbi:MAG: coproporphyrinogen III oxidase, partial [Actinobacteria bacterium]|nr:coproporphyrinogen III oxidase [Actinomycetota bacterium]